MARRYDVLVVGAGHAGVEAALAAARTGCRTLLLTFTRAAVGTLSCNPAVGGVGKGQLVRETDALGGAVARFADAAGIHFRILNMSKGPAVRSSRVQVDRERYAAAVRAALEAEPNLSIAEGEAAGVVESGGRAAGVETADGERLAAATVVLAPGTFLNGLMHVGLRTAPGGRAEEPRVSALLPRRLAALGLRTLRFKTGTCARLEGSSIRLDGLDAQPGDDPPSPLSFSTRRLDVRQAVCRLTHTTARTAEIIRANLDRSPLFSGVITGTGVRYCPSIEDKIVKFPHHERHHVFLEPETADGRVYYPNGLSTSLPEDAQDAFIRSIPGLEDVRILRYGYGIEHDIVDPLQLRPTLETAILPGLYLAGQINGTTGYEEAAAQGLVAGINASLAVRGAAPLVLDRSDSYIGVLIDDLVTRGTDEPYRMMTSRVERRLFLREDNADLRLRETGARVGLVPPALLEETMEKKAWVARISAAMETARVPSAGGAVPLAEYARRPGADPSVVRAALPDGAPDDALAEALIENRYRPYLARLDAELRSPADLEAAAVPPDFAYGSVAGLSLEIREKLGRLRPATLAAASRVPGVTPAAVAALAAALRGPRKKHGTKRTH